MWNLAGWEEAGAESSNLHFRQCIPLDICEVQRLSKALVLAMRSTRERSKLIITRELESELPAEEQEGGSQWRRDGDAGDVGAEIVWRTG